MANITIAGSRAPRTERRPDGGAGQLRTVSSAGPLTYLALLATLVLSAFPIYWTFVVASATNETVAKVPPALLPGPHIMENVRRVFGTDAANFAEALANTAIVASAVTVSVLLFSSLAGFAFAKLRFRGRNVLLLGVIGTMMIPTQLGIIPLYMMMGKLGWNGQLPAVIVPFMVSAFGVFFMRQYIVEAVPDELIEAARMDGCSTLRTYLNVVVPAIRPAAAVLGLLTFMMTWNEFLWPVVTLNPDNPTVQVSLNTLAAGYYQDYTLVLAGTALATVPLLLVFAVLGRQIIGGIMEGAVKG
jgi:cellobiose transport system permease protein